MVKALKDVKINPRIKIEESDSICFAVSCRHCDDPLCVKGCICGALSINDGVITIDTDRCVSCYTCIYHVLTAQLCRLIKDLFKSASFARPIIRIRLNVLRAVLIKQLYLKRGE
jgi:uncharacterized Fe-S center protein